MKSHVGYYMHYVLGILVKLRYVYMQLTNEQLWIQIHTPSTMKGLFSGNRWHVLKRGPDQRDSFKSVVFRSNTNSNFCSFLVNDFFPEL